LGPTGQLGVAAPPSNAAVSVSSPGEVSASAGTQGSAGGSPAGMNRTGTLRCIASLRLMERRVILGRPVALRRIPPRRSAQAMQSGARSMPKGNTTHGLQNWWPHSPQMCSANDIGCFTHENDMGNSGAQGPFHCRRAAARP
jgi:hypothetical protein